MGRWETFDHTADVGIKVTAANLNDLFRTSAEALFDYIVANRGDVRGTERETVQLNSDDPGELLVTWLNELIFLSETKHLLFGEFEVKIAGDGKSLEATIAGEAMDRDRHLLDHEVKAVTHHGLNLQQTEAGGWVAEFILDI